jgi:hypothetical protein
VLSNATTGLPVWIASATSALGLITRSSTSTPYVSTRYGRLIARRTSGLADWDVRTVAALVGAARRWERVVTTGPESNTDTIVEESVDYRLDEGDHERFSHYVPKDKLMQAMVEGVPVRALCGKLWVPSRDPQRFPVCPECKRIYDEVVPE